MRRAIIPAIALLAVTSCTEIPTQPASPLFNQTAGNTIYVAPPTGDPTQDRQSLVDAFSLAQEGDLVELAAGTYVLGLRMWLCDREHEDCYPTRTYVPTANNITIKGQAHGADPTVIDGHSVIGLGKGIGVWLLSGVTIQELTFDGFDLWAIEGLVAEDFTVSQVTVLGGDGWRTIVVRGHLEGVTISESVLTDSRQGMQVGTWGKVTITKNEISGTGDDYWQSEGIWVRGDNVTVTENVLDDHYIGIRLYLEPDAQVHIAENVITGSYMGIMVYDPEPDAQVLIAENVITDSRAVGMYLGTVTPPPPATLVVKENEIAGSEGAGLCIWPAPAPPFLLTLHENEFHDNAGGDIVTTGWKDCLPSG